MEQQRYITPKQAAELLNVERQTIYLWIKRGKLAAAKVGRGILVDKVAIDRMISGAIIRQLGEVSE